MKNKPEVPIKRTSGGIFMLFGVLADSNIMEYINMNNFLNMPDADMKLMLEAAAESPPVVTENE